MTTFPGPWFRVYWSRPAARVRLLMFPHGGGSASFYRPLAQRMAGDVEPVIVQYPGREDRLDDECVPDMAAMADRITRALLPLLDRPVVLFGHSMGASVAHEVALRLRALDRRPAMLIASGRPGPALQKRGDKHLDDDRLWDEVTRLNGTDTSLLLSEHVRQIVMPALRADYRLIETYRAPTGRGLDCPVAACVGADDDEVPVAESLAWRDSTTGAFTSRVFPGDHFFPRTAAEGLASWLAELTGRTQPRLAPAPRR